VRGRGGDSRTARGRVFKHADAHHPGFQPHSQGLGRIKTALADEALDAPSAPAAFTALLGRAAKEGWLPAEYQA
jgi:hypothetical protein